MTAKWSKGQRSVFLTDQACREDMLDSSKKKKMTYFTLLVWMFPLHVCKCPMCMWSLRRSEPSVRSLRTGDIDGYELPCGCWELNHGSLQEQKGLLAM